LLWGFWTTIRLLWVGTTQTNVEPTFGTPMYHTRSPVFHILDLLKEPPFKKNKKSLQCEAPKIAKLVYNSNNYGLWYL
jgi:hypothetical protein